MIGTRDVIRVCVFCKLPSCDFFHSISIFCFALNFSLSHSHLLFFFLVVLPPPYILSVFLSVVVQLVQQQPSLIISRRDNVLLYSTYY